MNARETRSEEAGGTGLAACLVPVACMALLMGLPPVLSLPGVLDVEGEALAFSGARALVALGLLAGAALGGRLEVRSRRAACLAGLAGSGVYVVLVVAALLDLIQGPMEVAIGLGLVANAVAFLGALLLAGTVGALWIAREALAVERTEKARATTPSFDQRVLALCKSRGLNETQSAIALCIVRGMGGAEICEDLSVAPGTVNATRAMVYRAFGVHSSAALAELVACAVANEKGPSGS